MNRRATRSAMLVAAASLLAGCYSFSELRVHETVRSGPDTAVLGIWIRAPGPVLSDPPMWLFDAAVAIVFYPWDVVSSTCVAVSAPFDPDLDVTLGPLGVVCGIALPGLTLMPYLYPARHMAFPPPDVSLDESSFKSLVARIKAGDGLRAYRELVGKYPWDGGSEAMISIELIEDGLGAAQQDAEWDRAPRSPVAEGQRSNSATS